MDSLISWPYISSLPFMAYCRRYMCCYASPGSFAIPSGRLSPTSRPLWGEAMRAFKKAFQTTALGTMLSEAMLSSTLWQPLMSLTDAYASIRRPYVCCACQDWSEDHCWAVNEDNS